MEYIKVSEAALKWDLSARRVRVLCEEGRIEGVIRKGKLYMIPVDAPKPQDGRSTAKSRMKFKKLLLEIDKNLGKLSTLRPLTQGEVKRLRDEFLIEFTYNSNAIEGNTLTLQKTAMVLEGVTIDQKPLKEHLEIIGHRDAFKYVESFVSEKQEFLEYVIKSGFGDVRTQPLFFLITTAGTDRHSVCFEQHQKAEDILLGRKIDPPFYPVIYGAGDEADWTSEKVWYEATGRCPDESREMGTCEI